MGGGGDEVKEESKRAQKKAMSQATRCSCCSLDLEISVFLLSPLKISTYRARCGREALARSHGRARRRAEGPGEGRGAEAVLVTVMVDLRRGMRKQKGAFDSFMHPFHPSSSPLYTPSAYLMAVFISPQKKEHEEKRERV